MTAPARPFADMGEALLLPRLVRITPNLHAAVFTLMKLVPARHILRGALQRGELDPDTVVVETTSGTFGLALAMETALLGRQLILVSDPVIDEDLARRLADLGAVVDIVAEPAAVGGYQESRLQRLAQLRAELPSSFCPEQYSNPGNPASYALVAEWIAAHVGTVDCLVGPVGSGGSMCGTVGALRAGGDPGMTAVAVDSHGSTLFGQPDRPRLLRGLGNSLMPANLDHTMFDEVHWCTAAEAYATTRWAHRRHALFQGPTSGAAMMVARWWAAEHPDARCVVMLPDEGHRYVRTVYDDAWVRGQGALIDAPPPTPALVSHPAELDDRWTFMRWGRRPLVIAVPDRAT